jgi:CRISPR-associated protein Cmr3
MMYSIIAEPIDTLFFRDGSPFNASENPFLKSMFPPSPHTGYGFSRAVLLLNACKHLESYIRNGCESCEFEDDCPITDVVGDPSRRDGTLQVKGPYVYQSERLFALPQDLTFEKDRTLPKSVRPAFVPDSSVRTDLGAIRLPSVIEGHSFLDEANDYLIPESALIRYLRNEKVEYSTLGRLRTEGKDGKSLVYGENRTGIAIDRSSGTSLEEHLYTIEMLRLGRGVSLWTGVEGLSGSIQEPTSQMTARLGGEAKRVTVQIMDGKSLPDPDVTDQIAETGRLKILLLQHADFGGSWHPPDFEETDRNGRTEWVGTLKGVDMTLVSAKTDKPIHIGGWDTAANRPRPLDALVPAGSVYYMEIDGDLAAKAVEVIHDQHIGLKTNLGFGHVAIGVWSNE